MKLHATLICKKRLLELCWEVELYHQDEQNQKTHWWLKTNIPYRSHSFVYADSRRNSWGVTCKAWKLTFNRKHDLVDFLKRYYKHYINFWDWDALEEAIVYEDTHIYKALHRPFPSRR